ncbi:MAG: PQQ-dependent sugar dehydrogenase [Alphaproteobacteria bacterium]
MNRRKILLWGAAYAVAGGGTWLALRNSNAANLANSAIDAVMIDPSEAHPFTVSDRSLRQQRFGAGLDEKLWGMCFLPDGEILVTEKETGRIRKLDRQYNVLPDPVGEIEETALVGQGGLMDIEPDPDYRSNRTIWVAVARRGPGGASTELVKARLNSAATRITRQETVIATGPKHNGGQHFGGRIVFDDKGHVYLSLGDRGKRTPSQDLGDHTGSVLRLNRRDGSVPKDNPFIDTPGAKPEIWTYGHRNPQGMAVHPETGEIWLHEHGPRGGDEVNLLKAGANYGWPEITHGREYGSGRTVGEGKFRDDVEPAKQIYIPSIAPSGMIIYSGRMFDDFKGDIFLGALRGQHLNRLVLDGDRVVRQERLLNGIGRIRSVEQAPDGAIWLLLDGGDRPLVRLSA